MRTRAHLIRDSHQSLVTPNHLYHLVMPCSLEQSREIHKTIDSILSQVHEKWLLTLVPEDGVREETHATTDDRISVFAAESETAEQTCVVSRINTVWMNSDARFVALIQPGVELEADVLTWAEIHNQRAPQTKWIYFDHFETAETGELEPICKPDFSNEYLLSSFFTGTFCLFEQRIIRKVKGLDPDAQSALLLDLSLRVSESIRSSQIQHVREFGYRQPLLDSNGVQQDQMRVIEKAFRRRNLEVSVKPTTTKYSVYQFAFQDSHDDAVTVIIPTRNQLALLSKCVHDIRQQSTHSNWNILVIDNRSDDPRMERFYRDQRALGRFEVTSFDEDFNYARMHNVAIRDIGTPYVVLVNNDVYGFSKRWIHQLVSTSKMAHDIACVGAKLRFPDGRLQHGGVTFGIGKPCRHAHLGLDADDDGYCGRLQAMQQFSALTAALLLIRTDSYRDVGGFDEDRFPVSFNDTDLCLKFLANGLRSIYNPAVTAVHEESISRGKSPLEKEWRRRFELKWGRSIIDPFYSPHLSKREFAVDAELLKIWQPQKQLSLVRALKAA